MEEQEFKGFPTIEEHLQKQGEGYPISIKEQEHIVHAIVAQTKLTEDQARHVLWVFWQEIRNNVLKGKIVELPRLGRMFVSSPLFGNKLRKSLKLNPAKSLLKKMNND